MREGQDLELHKLESSSSSQEDLNRADPVQGMEASHWLLSATMMCRKASLRQYGGCLNGSSSLLEKAISC